jgi:DNA modification methylase
VARVLEASSRPGDLVVDPFLGSGTTAVVARRLGRRFLGFEIEPDWVRLALKRLRERP